MTIILKLVPVLMAIGSVSAQTTGLVYYWPLDETEGEVAHDLSGGQHGAVQGGAAWQPTGGHHGGAIRLNTVTQRINLPACDMTTGGTGFSISTWVKPDMVSGNERMVIAKTIGPQPMDQAWSLSFVNATALRFRLRTAGTTHELTTTQLSIFSGAWYHLVCTYDGAHMRVHVNGSLLASLPVTGTIGFHPESPAAIGAQFTGLAPFSGWVDDVRIYDHGLSSQEIFDLLLGDVVTGMEEEPAPYVDGNGLLRIPTDTWTDAEVFDLAGRSVVARRPLQGNVLSMAHLATGVHLVHLIGPGREATRKVFKP